VKRYLVFMYDRYYPDPAWDQFKGSFSTLEEAVKFAKERKVGPYKRDYSCVVDLEAEEVVEDFHP
jgi:hypothetical protein